jgi:hypothetical protein
LVVLPDKLAEMLLDGMLASGLYRRCRGLDRRHWHRGVLRRTLPLMVVTALVALAAGWAMGRVAPEAQSLRGFVEHLRSR